MSDDNVVQFPRHSHGEDNMSEYMVVFMYDGRRYDTVASGPTEDIAVERAILREIGMDGAFNEVLIEAVMPV